MAIYSFPPFRLDVSSGMLFHNGRRINLPGKALQLLALLVERAGTAVLREEIQSELWPDGTWVDFERSINKLIYQIRSTLRDDPRKPGMIETIPQRGYRFIAPVTVEAPAEPLNAPRPGASKTDEPSIAPQEPASLPDSRGNPSDSALVDVRSGRRRWQRHIWPLTAAVLLCVAGALWMARDRLDAKSNQGEIRIGIVPFQTDGEGAEQLGSSVRMELADALSQLPRVQVRAMHSVTDTTNSVDNIRRLSDSLNLDVLIFANFSIHKNQFNLALELVRGRNAAHLSSLQYSGSLSELAVTRDRMQRDIFSLLETARTPWKAQQGSTANPEAYSAYLRGRFYLAQRTDASLQEALQAFQNAIKLDPQFARAYAGEASTQLLLAEHEEKRHTEAFHIAAQSARHALGLYPDLAEAHAVIGYIFFRADWNFQPAEQELGRAIELDPHQPVYHIWMALLKTTQGEFPAAVHEADEAKADDPNWPPVLLSDAFVSSSAKDWTRAKKDANHLVQLMPDWPLAHAQLGWVYWYTGNHEQAISEWRQMAVLDKDKARVALEDQGLTVLRSGGVVAYARLRINAAKSNQHWVHADDEIQTAEWSMLAGDRDGAIAVLQTQVDRHDPNAVELTVIPTFDPIHRDPRFQSIVARMGFANVQAKR